MLSAEICDPPTQTNAGEAGGNWDPFSSHLQFETANFLYHRNEMSGGDIDILLSLWEASLTKHDDHAPFPNHRVLYDYIDAIPYGDVPWESFTVNQPLDTMEGEPLSPWLESPQVVWYRNPLLVVQRLIANPGFKGEFDYVPYHEYIGGVHHFRDFMSGDWAWRQAISFITLHFS